MNYSSLIILAPCLHGKDDVFVISNEERNLTLVNYTIPRRLRLHGMTRLFLIVLQSPARE